MKSDEDAIRLRIADEIDQIADSAAFRLSGHSGVSVKRLRNRAAELRASSSTPANPTEEDA